ncbi:MAG TPA: thiamine pyrophosphate-dependent dehydrogenase E1 component subunit alpha [Solirubrobacteraceae bacterium]|jgi:acetoin:2,6-dichlorophenolindophenol oxidoreductase subunit alpha|nr:thiamine pyrophosphate-dependent dehydrogenase E1 component subunit alpha [Solirubrobacteraceae bacterium]
MTATEATSALGTDALLDLLRQMHEIRLFEEAVQRLFAQGLVRGSTHLCIGQEAVSVGVCSAMRPGDVATCTYRGHGTTLAMGAPLDRSFAEIMGRANGLCGGKGGSMHLTDVGVGLLGSFAIVGAHLPIAVGAAFARRYKGEDSVSVCFFGDGATNIGAFHESLNLAAIWKLPIVFVCENNLYGEYSRIDLTTPVERLVDRASSYAMRGRRADGNDVLGVRAEAQAAFAHARAGEGPTLLELLTYRWSGHSRTDPGTYRPEGELEAWKERDPIARLRDKLDDHGVDEPTCDAVRVSAERAVAEALERAKSWPEPELSSRFEGVRSD